MAGVNPPRVLVGRYQLLDRTLGRGRFAKVKLGLDLDTPAPHTRVALKVVRQTVPAVDPEAEVAIRREVRAMTDVQGPHVLRLRDVYYDVAYPRRNGGSHSVVLLVLDLAQGGELFDFLQYTGAFDERLARTYFHQLVDAVGSCHAQGYCHRDLKPENLLLDERFGLLVSDFNLAQWMGVGDAGRLRLLKTTCGTLSYIAPEVLNGAAVRYDGTAADVWSCGVVLFVLVAAFPPYQQPAPTDWWFNQLRVGRHDLFWQAHVRSVAFTPALQSFLSKLLAVDPTRRLRVADMVADEWFTGETLSADELQLAMAQRKAQVNVRQMQQRQERNRQPRPQDGFRGGGDSFERSLTEDDDPYRDYNADPNSTQLPPTQPAMVLGTFDAAAVDPEEELKVAVDRLAESPRAVPSRKAGAGGGAPPSPAGQPPIPVPEYDPSLTVPSMTLLPSPLAFAELHPQLMALLKVHRFDVKHNAAQHRYKARMLTPMGEAVELTIQLWSKPRRDGKEDGEELLLEFSRRSGDSAQYREIIPSLLVEMTQRGLVR